MFLFLSLKFWIGLPTFHELSASSCKWIVKLNTFILNMVSLWVIPNFWRWRQEIITLTEAIPRLSWAWCSCVYCWWRGSDVQPIVDSSFHICLNFLLILVRSVVSFCWFGIFSWLLGLLLINLIFLFCSRLGLVYFINVLADASFACHTVNIICFLDEDYSITFFELIFGIMPVSSSLKWLSLLLISNLLSLTNLWVC